MIAIYARVSTEEQAQHGASLTAQVEACRARLASTATESVQEFVDGGVSGSTLDRPALQALREAVADGRVRRIVVLDPDRLSRKLAHQLLLTEEWERAGVSLEFVNFTWADTPEGRLFYALRGAISEFEREKIRERARRGWMTKARQGQLVAGMQRYGYTYDKATKQFSEHPETAAVVREIFRLAADERLSTGRIAERLAAQGVSAPRGAVWWRDTVSKILRNPAYMGVAYVHRYDTRDHFRQRSEDEWIPISVPALVDEATWLKARDVIYHYRKFWKGRAQVPMLLRKLVVCGDCGHGLSTNVRREKNVEYRYYFCPNRNVRKYGTDGGAVPLCTLPWVQAGPLEDQVWHDVVRLMDDPAAWTAAEHTVAEEAPPTSKAPDYARELQRIIRARARLLDLIRKDLVTAEEAERQLSALKSEESHIRALQAQAENPQPSLPQLVQDLRSRLGHDLEHLPFDARVEIVRQLIDHITVSVSSSGTVTALIHFRGEKGVEVSIAHEDKG
ncbi:MAG: recombinase family protein [Thermaerobacter sp.]|nr:recombinase family protein [Thermaerobacter sp.]